MRRILLMGNPNVGKSLECSRIIEFVDRGIERQ